MNNRIFYPLLALIFMVPIVLLLWFWNQIPDIVPIHYNIHMEPDNWGPKLSMFIVPGITLFVIALMLIAPKIDPKQTIGKYMGAYHGLTLAIVAFMSIITSLEVLRHIGYAVPFDYIHLLTLLLFLFIGNVMLKIKPNYFIGIRTPWTLHNDEVWRRTHRVGGYIWVFASLIMLPIVLLTPPEVFNYLFLGYIAIIAGIPIVYSAIVYLQLKRQHN